MTMDNSFKGITRLLIVALLLLSTSCNFSSNTESIGEYHSKMLWLADNCLLEQVVTEYKKLSTASLTDPQLIMTYCSAIVETNRSLPANFSNLYHINEFARGCIEMYTGNLRDSPLMFIKLISNKEYSVWGDMGLLEYAYYTEAFNNMPISLRRLQEAYQQNSQYSLVWALQYYTAWYYYFSGQFDELKRHMMEHGNELDTTTSLRLTTYLLMRENRLEEAKRAIKAHESMRKSREDAIILMAYIISLEEGPAKCADYLLKNKKETECGWKIEKMYAEALIEAGLVEEGIEILKKLAEKRPHDIMLQLDLGEHVLKYGGRSDVVNLVKPMLDNKNFLQIAKYHLLLADIHLVRNEKDRAWEEVKKSLELDSYNPNNHWAMYRLYMDDKDYVHAEDSIGQILVYFPNDILALTALAELCSIRGDKAGVEKIKAEISGSVRYKSPHVLDKLKSL